MTISTRVHNELAQHRPGQAISAKELLHLGSRAGIDQALSRMTRAGVLVRIRRGVYAKPRQTAFGPTPPDPKQTVAELAKQTGKTIVPSGAAEANALGLTTQVPVRTIYLTSGRSQKLHFGNEVVELRSAPKWQLLLPETKAGSVIRALAWLGREADSQIEKLRPSMSEHDVDALLRVRAQLPTWLASEVSKLALAS